MLATTLDAEALHHGLQIKHLLHITRDKLPDLVHHEEHLGRVLPVVQLQPVLADRPGLVGPLPPEARGLLQDGAPVLLGLQ